MSDNINKINKILDPQRGPVDHPHLHEVCRDRLQHMTEELSRCDHPRRVQYFVGDTILRECGLRSDDQLYQDNNYPKATYGDGMGDMQVQMNGVCEHVRQQFDIYGYLGSGCEYIGPSLHQFHVHLTDCSSPATIYKMP
jgi:hypothetical protein